MQTAHSMNEVSMIDCDPTAMLIRPNGSAKLLEEPRIEIRNYKLVLWAVGFTQRIKAARRTDADDGWVLELQP